MQVALMPEQSPSSSTKGDSSAPDPPVSSSSDSDRLRASMEAWKRTAAVASERYGKARQRQIAVERDDRKELRKRWLEEEARKRAESIGKQKDVINGYNLSNNMPPPIYQSTPVNSRERKRHLESNDYGHEEWRQGFRLIENSGTSETSKTSTDVYVNYPQSNAGFCPGMMMSGVQQQSCKGIMPSFPTGCFPSNASYPVDSYPITDGMSSSRQSFPSERTPKFSGSFQTQHASHSTLTCSSMPSTSTADMSFGQRYPSMELAQFPASSDCVSAGSIQSQQALSHSSDPTSYGCDMRPSSSMCPTSPNEVPTPPALVNSGGGEAGNSCASLTTVVEQSLRSPAEDLGCNAVNEDNMTRMLTSIPNDSLGMLGADAVDSLLDNDTASDGATEQVPIVTSTDPNTSPPGFCHAETQSVHSTHSAPQSNGNCNPPSTPTIDAPAVAASHSNSFQQMSTSQSTSFPQQSPSQPSVFPQQSPSQNSNVYPSTVAGQPSTFAYNSSKNAYFVHPSSSQSMNYPVTTMETAASFSTSSSQSVDFVAVSQQSSGFPQHNPIYTSFPHSGAVHSHIETLPSTSNPYLSSSSASGIGSNAAAPMFAGQQEVMNSGFTMNGYPVYDMPSTQMSQRQMVMQAQHQQQMAMAVGLPGPSMNAQQYHMAMMQKHQQNVKAMMQQRAAMMYHGYPNGAAMSEQQYFMYMQKMQQSRFQTGVDPTIDPSFMSGQRTMSIRGSPIGAGVGAVMDPIVGSGAYPPYSQTFAAQQQYVGQFPMN